jgi:replicative DNA helicase
MEAEQGIIGCCLLEPEGIDTAIEARCQISWFYDIRHQELWSTLTCMRADGTQIDLITFGQKLKDRGQLEAVGGLGYLSELMDSVPSASNLSHYLSIAADKSCRRRLLQAATRVMEVARDETQPSEAAAAEAESEILRVRSEYDAESDPTMKELMREAIDELQDRIENGDKIRIPTHFPPIDRVMKGGPKPGNVVVIAARPSTGKTSLAMTLIRTMAAGGEPVGFFSLEMNKQEITQAMAAQESGTRWGEFSKDNKPTTAELRAMTGAAGRLARLPIQIVDGMWKGKTYKMNMAAIAAKTRRWVKKHGTKAIFIDYLQMIPSSGRGDNRQEKVAEISNQLKALAQELGIVVIVLAQLNREYEKDGKRKPRLSDLRESGAIEQDADFVGMLYSPEAEDMWDPDSMVPVRINMYVAKQRTGIRFVDVPLNFRRAVVRFEPVGPA